MKHTILSMYITLLPVIISGILNMIWCKLPILKFLKKPIDANKNFVDGRRIFGDNKTWKGLFGYLLFHIVMTVLWGIMIKDSSLEQYNFFYLSVENNVLNNLTIGLLLGLGYSLFELPNSFLKRRLGIVPGKSIHGFLKIFFIFLDQADSVFGCVLVICFYYPMSIGFYFTYVFVGALTHIIFNMLLYFAKLRKNMF